MKNILIPTDFSLTATSAICFALTLFREEYCNFYLLHVITSPTAPKESSGDVLNTFSKEIPCPQEVKSRWMNTRKEIKKYANSKHKFHLNCGSDTLPNEVESSIKINRIDYLIIGSKSSKEINETVQKFNVSHLLNSYGIPVFLLPKNYTTRAIVSAFLATDYRCDYKIEELEQGLTLLDKPHRRLLILHQREGYRLSQKQQENKLKLNKKLSHISHTMIDLREGLLLNEVLQYVQKQQTDIFIVMHRFYKSVNQFLAPKMTNYLLVHCKKPILFIKDTSTPLSTSHGNRQYSVYRNQSI